MHIIINFFRYLFTDPGYIVLRVLSQKWFPISDRRYLEIWYRLKTGEKLNLDNPRTYNEKLQWLKLYDHQPVYTTMVDKYAVKQYVTQQIGGEYVIPLLGVWNSPEEIDFDSLPDQFVLKVTHGGGSSGVVICKDKDKLDKKKVIYKLRRCMVTDGSIRNREWPYKNVPRRVIAEEYIEDDTTKELRDYKFFCFNGVIKCFKIDFNRFVEHRANYYDKDYNLLPFGEAVCPPNYNIILKRPQNFEKMIDIVEVLSQGIPFVRVDLYNVGGKIYFGEFTFFPAAGCGKFIPPEWDALLGDWIHLPR